MQKKIPLGLTVLVVILTVAVAVMVTYVSTVSFVTEKIAAEYSAENEESLAFRQIKALFNEYYIGELDEEAINEMMITGYVVGTGDKYAYYYPPEDYASLQEDLNGEMQGIGVSVIYNADYKAIEVINVFPDSPALEAGVEVGDLIMYVGDDMESVSSLGYNLAINKVKGEAGTIAKFVAYRGAGYEEEIVFEIPRKQIKEQTVTYRLYSLDSTVGIIKISSFDTGTVEQFNDALNQLTAMGAEKIVFDLRNNPGGELNSICSILDTLLPEGPVIRTINNKDEEKTVYTSDEKELDLPMAVVVNSNTASAAELFSSAMQDYDKAEIVGTVTYGKGCMQSMYPLANGGCISLTTALYCPPFSDNYDGIGVTPDVEVELTGEAASKNIYKLTDEEDSQLSAAVATFAK